MKKWHCIFLVIGAVSMGAVASAQQAAPGGGGDRYFPMVNRVLTASQRQALFQILGAQRERIRTLEESIRASRQAMLNQVAAGKFDENLIRKYAMQSAEAEADVTVIFARALSQMKPPLSPQQIAQIRNFEPGRFREARRGSDAPPAPEVHLKLPPSLPTDTNGLPIVN